MATKLPVYLIEAALKATTATTNPNLINQLNSVQNAKNSMQRKVSIEEANNQKRSPSTSKNK